MMPIFFFFQFLFLMEIKKCYSLTPSPPKKKKVVLDFSVCYANIFIEKAGAKGGSPIKTNEAH